VAGGVWGSDAMQLLECVPEKVAMLALEWAPCVVLGPCVHAPLVSLTAGLGFDVPALPPQ
jgi:hypothetical protein